MFMKAKHFFIAGMALVAFASCSKETGSQDPIFKGDKAYINVQLAYADPETRGIAADPAFYYGTAEENKVNKTDFFFYNSDGSFQSYASKTLTWKDANGVDQGTTDNVERISEGVVVLENLRSTAYPAYMAVVLNGDENLIAKLQTLSMQDAQKEVISAIATADVNKQTDWTNFVMTSSTYNNGDAASCYYCEKLTSDNFQETEAAAKDTKPVVAYVERLAAKVKVAFGDALANDSQIGDFEVDGKTTALYFHVDGWGLNATAKDSYAFKNIDKDWSLGDFTWNDATNHRSYWAKYPMYGDAAAYYPTSAADAALAGAKTPTLAYSSYNDLAVELGKNAYCRENTNTEKELEKVFAGAVTSVLLKAKVGTKEGDEFKPVELVNYQKSLYAFDNYVNAVLSGYKAAHSGANILVCDGGDPDKTYSDITKDNLEVVDLSDGVVYLRLKPLTAPAYYCTGSIEGKTYSESISDEAANKLLNGEVENEKATQASYYKGGMMYYNIPVEHLRQGVKFGSSNFDKKNVKEAEFGVVRNHYYMVTVNSIKNLGKAVYDPNEIIVPGDNDNKFYYVGAQINILSWKVVKQDVDL